MGREIPRVTLAWPKNIYICDELDLAERVRGEVAARSPRARERLPNEQTQRQREDLSFSYWRGVAETKTLFRFCDSEDVITFTVWYPGPGVATNLNVPQRGRSVKYEC